MNIDNHKIEDFYRDIIKIKQDIKNITTKKEIKDHFDNILFIQNILFLLGIFFIWVPYNIFSIVSLTLFTVSRWTITGHHVAHGGYDNLEDKRYNRKTFGSGFNRFIDWFDWFSIEAWKYEHNKFHHYYLNEINDPDLLEHFCSQNIHNKPMYIRIINFIFSFFSWRWLYYTSNTYDKYYKNKENINTPDRTILINDIFWNYGFLFDFLPIISSYFLYQFILIPLVASIFLGTTYGYYAFINLIISELLSNMYSFMIIVTNHVGSDLYRFSTKCKNEKERVFRAAIGSTNYNQGTEIIDFLHGYLNYQIEHHMFPELSALEYKKMAPMVKEVCKKHNIQYVQENVFIRTYKTFLIFIGYEQMKQI